MIGRLRRWWKRTFGQEFEIFDTSDIHEMLANRVQEWKEDFHPDKW